MKRKPRHYFNETFRMNCYFCVGWSKKQIQRYMKDSWKYTSSSWGAGKTLWCVCDNGADVVIVWTAPKEPISSLVHECVHAANIVLEARGQPIDQKSDEVQAYLVEEIFRKATNQRRL